MLPRFRLPIPAAEFLRDYWQRQPLLAPASATGLDVPDPNVLAGLALEDSVESRIILGSSSAGAASQETPWSVRHGPFSEADLQTLPDKDWTLLVQSVDYCLTEVSLMLDSFDFLPGWRLEDIMISYAVTGGSVGPHFDQYDVFLIQAAGHRRWKLGPHCDAATPLQPHESLRLLADMPVTSEHLLGPGDVLYVPPGVAHWGVAEDDDCVTWSVGFRAPRHADLLARITDEVLSEVPDTLFTDAGRGLPDAPGTLSATDAQALTQQALGLITPTRAECALAQLLSEPRHNGLDFEVDTGHIRAAAPGASLVRHGSTRLLADSTGLWINGEHHSLPADAQALGTYLASRRLYEQSALMEHAGSTGLELLNEWIEQGFFVSLE
ncbi:cupin domain-containing protein [Alcanivorax sp. JB21]|uniref:cupin domain-containing protein n=1 Tax=Alcanivorax limicola TaxID=2874102 RepID=UPI001CBC62EB|nr:cupin domain-containing protein [Alcanivorax limicola]MBZ2187807.1 cupin domain-containing protein [Alcanivorax limicola]